MSAFKGNWRGVNVSSVFFTSRCWTKVSNASVPNYSDKWSFSTALDISSVSTPTSCDFGHPDVNFVVDGALKNNYLSFPVLVTKMAHTGRYD